MIKGGARMRRLFHHLKLTRKAMLKKLLKLLAASAAVLAFAASFAPSFAYSIDPQVYAGTKLIPARECSATQNMCYLRVKINYNDPEIANGVWFATLPKSAYILAIDVDVTAAFDASGNNYLSIGATQTGTNFLATTGGGGASVDLTSATVQHATAAAGLGLTVTGNSTYQTQINGAVPVYVRYIQTTNPATHGSAVILITYAKNDDQ
jgi:hypothetical protein